MSKPLTYDNTNKTIAELDLEVSIIYVFFEGGNVLSTGVKGDLRIPFDCEIQQWTLQADDFGLIQIDIWKDTFNNFPPTDTDSITGSLQPYLDNEDAYRWTSDLGNYDWDTTISEGDILRFYIDYANVITRCTLSLQVIRT